MTTKAGASSRRTKAVHCLPIRRILVWVISSHSAAVVSLRCRDIGGLTGDADLDMEIVDLSWYEVQKTLGKGGMGEVLLATDTLVRICRTAKVRLSTGLSKLQRSQRLRRLFPGTAYVTA